MNEYKFIYYCPKCKTILLKSNQHLASGEIQCLKCEVDEGESTPIINFKDLIIKVIPVIAVDKNKLNGLE